MKQCIVVCLSLIFVGCAGRYSRNIRIGLERFPQDIWIDERFSKNNEEAVVLDSMNEWERATGENLFEYKGRAVDRRFTMGDLYDNEHIIYKVESRTRTVSRIERNIRRRTNNPRKVLLGYGRKNGDVVIVWYRFIKSSWLLSHRRSDKIHYYLKELMMHELGHFLGLGHSDNPESVMQRGCAREVHYPEPLRIPSVDVDSFREIHGYWHKGKGSPPTLKLRRTSFNIIHVIVGPDGSGQPITALELC